MAASNKKSKRGGDDIADLQQGNEDDVSEEGSDDEMDDEEEEPEDELMNQEVQIDFTARTPEDCDFHGIKKLLQQVFLKANINLSELTDTIISQNYVGSVIMQSDDVMDDEESEEDDEMDVFGVTTVLNIMERKNLDSIKQLTSFLMQKCKESNTKKHEEVAALLNDSDHHIGYLINERFINIPAQIALPTFDSLWKEVERAKQKKMPYSFSYYLMVCKTYKVPMAGGNKQQPQLVFTNPEEEFFYEASKVSYSYSVAGERDTGVSGDWDEEDTESQMEPLRTILLIPAASIPNIMTTLQENLAT